MVTLLLCVGAVAGLSSSPASAATSQESSVSSNWSGYAVTGTSFSSVSGSWVQPTAACARGTGSYSAFWVGLGGFDPSSQALEQIGTSADCSASGRVSYHAWYELVPAASVPVRELAVSAGDTVAASVSVTGSSVTLQLQNVATGASFSQTLPMTSPDVGSAEWIAEAPAACNAGGSACRTLPLANFGTVAFSSSSATAAGHSGTVSDPAWSATSILLQGASGFRRFSAVSAAGATPSALSADGSGFTVTWQQGVPRTRIAPWRVA